jgi:hypothetical protein
MRIIAMCICRPYTRHLHHSKSPILVETGGGQLPLQYDLYIYPVSFNHLSFSLMSFGLCVGITSAKSCLSGFVSFKTIVICRHYNTHPFKSWLQSRRGSISRHFNNGDGPKTVTFGAHVSEDTKHVQLGWTLVRGPLILHLEAGPIPPWGRLHESSDFFGLEAGLNYTL